MAKRFAVVVPDFAIELLNAYQRFEYGSKLIPPSLTKETINGVKFISIHEKHDKYNYRTRRDAEWFATQVNAYGMYQMGKEAAQEGGNTRALADLARVMVVE